MFAKRMLLTALMLCFACATIAGIPPAINYQGKLMQPSGAPVPDGTYPMVFAIYGAPTDGTPLWSETNPAVQVKGGLFAAMLGSVINLPANIFDSPDRWFGIKVGNDAEMSPRQQIASVAYAHVAGTVPSGSITADRLAPGISTPPGTISMYAGTTAPEGWLFCNGQAVSRTEYASLFAAIGTAYGSGDGSTTFNLPDMQDRFAIGISGTRALGVTGGEASHILTIAEMPVHTHAQSAHTHTENAHSHGISDPGHSHAATNGWSPSGDGYSHAEPTQYPNDRPTSIAYTGISINNATATIQNTTATNQNSGEGSAHNNIPPYLAVNYIIKI